MEDYKKKYKDALDNFKKIKAANKDKKELVDFIEYKYPELKESKSEDEKIRKALAEMVHDTTSSTLLGDYGINKQDALTWLERQDEQKLIDKIQLGKKYKCIASPRYSTFMIGEIYKPEDKFLYSLMNFCSNCFEPIEDGKQKPTWSEEDENMLQKALSTIRYALSIPADKEDDPCFAGSSTIAWLKSLKERYTWKPSDEQMDALDYYANSLCTYCDRQDDLRSLFNDLKKLKGE